MLARRVALFGALFALFLAIWLAGPPAQPLLAQSTIPEPPPWVEPRGVNIADLVGVVPEDHLRGAIISYSTGVGFLQYEWGVRTGDDVIIRAQVFPNYHASTGGDYTAMGCLGQPAYFDQWPTVSPPSTMRLYAGDQEITWQINFLAYTPAQLGQPTLGAGAHERYTRLPGQFLWLGTDPLTLPANMGCFIAIPGRQSNLSAEFHLKAPQKIAAQYVVTRECTAHSYIGYLDPTSESPLDATGVLAPLARQMALRFGNRHDKCPLESPAGADFILVNYPPTPFDPYPPNQALLEADPNFLLPGSGTYRLEARGGGLSVDHVSSFAMPLHGQWQDSDQSSGKEFLNHFTDLVHLSSPEYFIPPGFDWNGSFYDRCMVRGGCPDALLDALYNATYTFKVHFYRFDRVDGANLARVPVKQTGVNWTPAIGANAAPTWMTTLLPSASEQFVVNVFVPLVGREGQFGPAQPGPNPPGENPSDCPCGWFDEYGRMYDYIAKPTGVESTN